MKESIERILTAKVQFHLWFIYTLIGIYLFLPIIQLAFSNPKNHKAFYIYLLFWSAGTVIYPTFKTLFDLKINIPQAFNLSYFSGYLGYFIIGGLLKNLQTKGIYRAISFIAFSVSTLLIYYLTKKYSYFVGRPHQLFFGYLSPFVVTQAISFFILLKDSKHSFLGEEFLANHTYWMYLIHILILTKIQYYFSLSIIPDPLLNIPLIASLTFVFSFFVSIPLYRIEQVIMRYIK